MRISGRKHLKLTTDLFDANLAHPLSQEGGSESGRSRDHLINRDDTVTDTVDRIQTPLTITISRDFVNVEVEMLYKYL